MPAPSEIVLRLKPRATWAKCLETRLHGILARALLKEPLRRHERTDFRMASTSTLPVSTESDDQLIAYLNLKLREIGQPGVDLGEGKGLAPLVDHFLAVSREKDRALSRHLAPVDQRIQNFLYLNLETGGDVPGIPATTLVLDRPDLARVLSLPPDADRHQSDILSSHRVRQGVLHNPRSDRRTTKGIFHVADLGMPVPDDKKAVPPEVFGRLLARALNPPPELLRLPFTATAAAPAECFVSLYLRPLVCPAVPGFTLERTMETRFFVPGALVANLDFIERIFGNAGDPHLPENDAALDPEHWTGHTGCVVLAPHLNTITKRDLGLPCWEDATPRQQRDGMCWREPGELYNDGSAFKLTARDASGTIVTFISDNYFGYCKKEVKAQISFASNLLGQCEEEHAGGAIVFPSYDLGEDFRRLTRRIGLRDSDACRGPRIHDLRHRFAVATLLRWYRSGRRIDPLLPVLSTYMGHVSITGTYWYLTCTPELMAAAGARLEKRWEGGHHAQR